MLLLALKAKEAERSYQAILKVEAETYFIHQVVRLMIAFNH